MALANFDARVRTITEAVGATTVLLAFSCPSRVYHRHKLWDGYKAGRGAKPEALSSVREHTIENYETRTKPSLEADDVLGIIGTMPNKGYDRVVIVTTDKDLNQIPGFHLNPDKLDAGIYETTKDDGDRFHLYQTLVGDSCDGYPGCPGIGPKKADRILEKCIEGDARQLLYHTWYALAWREVVATFIKKGLTEEDALLQARLARILRAEDWDFKKKEPRLWTPS